MFDGASCAYVTPGRGASFIPRLFPPTVSAGHAHPVDELSVKFVALCHRFSSGSIRLLVNGICTKIGTQLDSALDPFLLSLSCPPSLFLPLILSLSFLFPPFLTGLAKSIRVAFVSQRDDIRHAGDFSHSLCVCRPVRRADVPGESERS